MEVPKAQRRLIKIVNRLDRLTHQLHEVVGMLPRPTDRDRMFDDEIAYDASTRLDVCVRLVLEEHLRPATEQLRSASTVTDEGLRDEFEVRSRAPSGPSGP